MAALVSVLPIVLLFVLMLGFKMAGHRSAFVSLLATAAIAVFLAPAMNFAPEGFTQSGVAWAFVEGALKAVFPILIIILMALFSYNVLVESKQIEVIKAQFTSFSDDDGVPFWCSCGALADFLRAWQASEQPWPFPQRYLFR